MTPRAATAAVLLLATLALGGCADRREWRNAQAADTIEAYEAYLAQRPQGDYVPPAERRLAELREQRDWRIATERDTAEAYRAFIDAHPKGRWVSEARIRIQNSLLDPMPPPVEDLRPPTEADETAAAAAAAAPAAQAPAAAGPVVPAPGAEDPIFDAPAAASPPAAPAAPAKPAAPAEPAPISHRIQLGAFGTREQAQAEWAQAPAAPGPVEPAAASEDPIFDAPAAASPPAAPAAPAKPAAPAAPAEPAPISHRIQLGAFGTREQAQAEWAQARTRHRELQGLVPVLTPVTAVNGASMWRLQAGVVSQARAREICDTLQAARQPCVYAPPGR